MADETEKIIDDREATVVSAWINRQKYYAFNLLYSSKRDGVSSRTFHSLCNGKGPTVSIAKFRNGLKIGGYASTNFQSRNVMVSIPECFVFSLANDKGKAAPVMYKCNNSANAIHDFANAGPQFGSGPDLSFIADDAWAVSAKNGAFQLTSEFTSAVTAAKDQIEELQVFEATEILDVSTSDAGSSVSAELKVPTVVFSVEEHAALRARLQAYKLDYAQELGMQYVNVVLAGHTGSGKSSLFNTLQAADAGKLFMSAVAGTGTASVTKILQKRFPSMNSASRFPVCIWDTMGWGDNLNAFSEKFSLILDGNVARNTDLAGPFGTRSKGFVMNPSFADRAHVLVLVASAVDATDAGYLSMLREVKELAMRGRETTLRVVMIVTHVDEFDPALKGEGVQNVYASTKLRKLFDSIARGTGVSESRIFPVRCYAKESEPDMMIDIIAMRALECMLVQVQGMLMDLYEDMVHSSMEDAHKEKERNNNTVVSQ